MCTDKPVEFAGAGPLLLLSSSPNPLVTFSSAALDITTCTSRRHKKTFWLVELPHSFSPALQQAAQRGCTVSSLRGFPDLAKQWPEEPPLISWSTLLWAAGWNRDLLRSLPAWITFWPFLAFGLTLVVPSLPQNAHPQLAVALVGLEHLSPYWPPSWEASPSLTAAPHTCGCHYPHLQLLALQEMRKSGIERDRFCKPLSREVSLSHS